MGSIGLQMVAVAVEVEVENAEEISTNKRQLKLNPKAQEFQPSLLLSATTTKSLPLPPPPPHTIWHGGWFLSHTLPPPAVLKPNYHFYYYPYPTSTATTYSYRDLAPPLLKLAGTLPKPEFIRNRRSSARRGAAPAAGYPSRILRRRGCCLPKANADCAWVVKPKKNEDNNPAHLSPPPPAGGANCDYPFGTSTSLMIRNIPVRLSQGGLMKMLDEHCREENQKLLLDSLSTTQKEPPSEFDFLYLPIDFRRKGNKGYAFVNFTHWEGAARLLRSWSGTNWLGCGYSTQKICRFSPARFQGGKALKKHFQKSVFRCESEEYLPVEITPPRNGSNADITTLTSIGTRLPC